MELLQLKYFCDAAKTENFSKTAKRYNVPPSDISQSIKRLEKELSCSLFDRRANSITLNPKGKAFFDRIKIALSEIEAAVSEATDDGISGQIKIGININRRTVMETVERFSGLYPQVDIVVKHGVVSGFDEFDLIIAADDMSDRGLIGEKLFSEDILLAVNKKDPLSQKEVITAADLSCKPFVSMGYGENLYILTEDIGKKMGFTPHIAIQGDDPFYIRRCVELGLGVAFVPGISWGGQFSSEVLLKKVGDFKRTAYVCRDRKKYMSACCKMFLDMLFSICDRSHL
jgi:DNA-binding transcriptional LysR family regulator